MNMKRVFLFGSQITVGGAQRVLLDQADWFWDQGYDVRAVFFYDKDGMLRDWSLQHPYPIAALSVYQRGAGFGSNFSGLFHGFIHLVSMLRRVRPDYFESFTHDANLMGIPAAWLCGVKGRFASHHGQFAGQSALSRKLHTRIINSAMTTKLICVSERAKQQALAEGIREEKIEVIFNGVRPVEPDPAVRAAMRKELGLGEQDVMILSVGRLTPEKAQKHFVRAAARLLPGHPERRFFIAGEGPCRKELEQEIKTLGLRDHFRLLGNRSDVDRLLNAADLFVLYSDTEGMPVSLMEAMSAALPCVASGLEGIAQLIPDESFGTLIPAGDSKKLADTLEKVLSDPQKCKAQGQAAARRIREKFSLDTSCARYKEVFERYS